MKTAIKVTTLVLFAALVASRVAGAQDALSLKRARELTLSRSATLHSAQLAVDAASLAAQAQGYAALPNVTTQAGASYDYSLSGSVADPWSGSAGISVSETIFNGGKTGDLVKKYGYATESARESFRSTRISLVGQADAAFFAVLEAQASVDAAASDLEAAQQRQTIAQAKIDAGSLSKSAYLQTQADTAGYETTLLVARKTLASAKAKMASLTGLPLSTALEQVDFSSYGALLAKLSSLDEAAIDKLATDVTALAKANSPSLSIDALASRQARLGIAIAKKAYMPTVAAGLSQNLSYSKNSATGQYGSTYPGSLSLTATMNLDLWNTKNAVDSAAVASAQAELGADQGLTDLELNVVQALYEWMSSANAISSAAKALDYARSNYQNVLEEFKLSSATTSDLSTAQALVSSDETALIKARYGFLSSLSTLRGYAGLEDEAAILAAIP